MGMKSIGATVTGPKGSEQLEFLVDSGAMYTVIPADVWLRIGLEAEKARAFSLADGTHIDRPMSECRLTMPEGSGTVPVILGEPGDHALLGVTALEYFGLMLNPLTRELVPMRLHL